ncbi:MAG: hypothetical protein AAF559_13080 [Pseudomonadota bacterium]
MAKITPAFELEDFLNDPNSVFEDEELGALLMAVKTSNEKFLYNIGHYGGAIRGEKDFHDMIPFREKDSGLRSERTKARIHETNERADRLAYSLTELFASFRTRGVSLIKQAEPPSPKWRPLND